MPCVSGYLRVFFVGGRGYLKLEDSLEVCLGTARSKSLVALQQGILWRDNDLKEHLCFDHRLIDVLGVLLRNRASTLSHYRHFCQDALNRSKIQ